MRGRWLGGGSAVIAAATLVACASSPGRGRTAANCGTVPTSSGPLADVAHLAIKAPTTVSAGQSVPVSATVTSKSDLPRVITTPATSVLLVVRGGRVMGRALGKASAPRVPLQLQAGAAQPAQVIPESVRLTGCGSDIEPDMLAAGRYALVGVLGYELDSLNAAPADGTAPPQPGGRSFALVSAPAPIAVEPR